MYRHVHISDAAVWQKSLDQWLADASVLGDEGIFLATYVDQKFRGIKDLNERCPDQHGYFLIKNGSDFASTLLEISHAKPNSTSPWLKLLNVTLRPALLPRDGQDPSVIKEAVEAVAFSISHVLSLTFTEHPSKVLKVYGRTQEMRNLFSAIISVGGLDQMLDALQLSVRLEGSWLVITKIES